MEIIGGNVGAELRQCRNGGSWNRTSDTIFTQVQREQTRIEQGYHIGDTTNQVVTK